MVARWMGPVVVVVAASVGSAAAVAADPTLEEIFAACVEGAGGREAVDGVKSLHTVTSLTMADQPPVTMEQWWSREGGRLVEIDTPFGKMTMGSDGETPWVGGPMGYMLATEDQARQIDGQGGMLMSLIDPKTFGKNDLGEMAVAGRGSFAGRDCWKVKFTKDETSGYVYFDTETGLPVGSETRSEDAGAGQTTMTVSDWKAVKGVTFFHKAKIELTGAMPGGGTMEITTLEVNTVKPETFALPADVQRLKSQSGSGGAGEVKLEDLTAQQRAQAEAMIAKGKEGEGTAALSEMIQGIEGSLGLMPPDQQVMFRYVVQELKKELARRGG